jgi:hypothetical protein
MEVHTSRSYHNINRMNFTKIFLKRLCIFFERNDMLYDLCIVHLHIFICPSEDIIVFHKQLDEGLLLNFREACSQVDAFGIFLGTQID